MNELIENVAEILLNKCRTRNGFPPGALSEMTEKHKAEWIDDAHAAILATLEGSRNPSNEARIAAEAIFRRDGLLVDTAMILQAHNAMIAELIKELKP